MEPGWDDDFPQTTSVVMHFDSRDRDYVVFPSSSSFKLRLPTRLHNITSASLVSTEIPLTYYAFSAARGNTTATIRYEEGFWATDNEDVMTTDISFTIPDGTYDEASMATAVYQGLLRDFDSQVMPSLEWAISIDPASEKTVIDTKVSETVGGRIRVLSPDREVAPNGNGKRFNEAEVFLGEWLQPETTFVATNARWGLGYHLGFSKYGAAGVESVVTGQFGPSWWSTGPYGVNLDSERYLLLDIEELNGSKTIAMRNSFAKVPLDANVAPFGLHVQDQAVSCSDIPPMPTLDKLSIALRFPDGALVDLNGRDWSFSIEFTCTRVRAP